MSTRQTLILDSVSIQQKINRIAYQILEENYEEQELYFIGVRDNGYLFAEKLVDFLKTITKIEIHLYALSLNKKKPNKDEMEYNFDLKSLNKKTVILVDDVANTGRTLAYAMKPLFDSLPKKIEVAVLIDREHKLFPISSDYVGLSLSTTHKEHVNVVLDGKEDAVYLE
ncbi:bifunctional pyr operon transcriptional regulator/uracil phosphoribosyltransferase PyrR [soil metagenome]